MSNRKVLFIQLFAYPNPVCTQFQIGQVDQTVQILNFRKLVTHKEQVFQTDQVLNILNMTNLVE
jgi:hypothetical protein